MRRFMMCVLAAACAAVAWAARPGDASGVEGFAQKKGQSRKGDATPTPTPTPARKLQPPSGAPSPNVSTDEKREPTKTDKPEYNEDDPALGPKANLLPSGTEFRIQKALTGTFALVLAGESPQDIAKRATQSLPEGKRAEVYEALVRRLQTPERLAIEQRGGKIKIASTAFEPVTLETNWSASRTSSSPYSAEYRAPPFGASGPEDSVGYGELVIRASGVSDDDFFRAVFKPVGSGSMLSVMREVSVEGLPKPILVQSVYQRVSDAAKFDDLNVKRATPAKEERVPPPTKDNVRPSPEAKDAKGAKHAPPRRDKP